MSIGREKIQPLLHFCFWNHYKKSWLQTQTETYPVAILQATVLIFLLILEVR